MYENLLTKAIFLYLCTAHVLYRCHRKVGEESPSNRERHAS